MDYAVPESKIATFSSGEFAGIVADSPNEKIKLKMFHGEIQNDHEAITMGEADYVPIPVLANVTESDVEENYMRVKKELADLVSKELKKIKAMDNKKSMPQKDRPEEAGKMQRAWKVKEGRPSVKRNGRNVSKEPIRSVSM